MRETAFNQFLHDLFVHLLKKMSNLRMVQKQFGYASPVVTENMYADVSFEDMENGLDGLYNDAPEEACLERLTAPEAATSRSGRF